MDYSIDVDNEVSPNDLKILKEELRVALNEIEELRQQTYDQKRVLNESTFIIANLTQECTVLQLGNDELKLQESEHLDLISELRKKLKYFDNESNVSMATDTSIEVSRVACPESHDDVELIMNENKTLIEELVLLKTSYFNCKAELEKLQSSKTILESVVYKKQLEISGLNLQLECVNSSVVVLEDQLQSMQNDFTNTVDQLRETKDDLVQVQGELHIAKAPVMQSRGNSIFSELEDNRLKLVSKYNDLKSKYTDLSKKYVRQAHDISKLMSEKVSAARLVEEMGKEEELADRALIDSLELRIRHLEEQNKQLTSELKVPIKIISDVDSGTLKYVETLVADTKQAMWTLKKELDDRSIALLMNQQLTNTCMADLRCYKVENLKLRNVISCQKSAALVNIDVGKSNPKCDQSSPKHKLETLSITHGYTLDALSNKHSHYKDLAKVTKKLTFYDELPITTSEMQNGQAGVEADACVELGVKEATATVLLRASSSKHAYKDLAKVTKKLTFHDELPITTSEMQNGQASVEADACVAVELGVKEATATVLLEVGSTDSVNSNTEESLVSNAPKQVPKPVAKMCYPKLEISFKK